MVSLYAEVHYSHPLGVLQPVKTLLLGYFSKAEERLIDLWFAHLTSPFSLGKLSLTTLSMVQLSWVSPELHFYRLSRKS